MAKKITEEQKEKLVERLLYRVEKANQVFLKAIGESIDEMQKLTPSKAHQLQQILKYGGKYDEIVKQMQKYTNMNIQDIDDIFKAYAKKDQEFYKQFYQYRDIPYVKYEDNELLKRQTEALSNVVKNQMYNFTRDNVLGYTVTDEIGRVKFAGLSEVYNKIVDLAFMNIDQGKETFDEAMSGILQDIGKSGLKTIQYESGRSIRLDSAVRMHINARLGELHNENQKLFGQEFGADGYEITVHDNPAIDHEEVQGRQFSIAEYDRLDSGLDATDYKGNTYNLHLHTTSSSYRPISELNCKHDIYAIILGVSEPDYTDEELLAIRQKNDAGFEFEGKHYTMYEGTQLQRNIERKIREQKDIQILARKSKNNKLIAQSQTKITQLTNKYKELSKISGLPTRMDRMAVTGYRRVKIVEPIIQTKQKIDTSTYSDDEVFNMYIRDLEEKGIDVEDSIMLVDKKIRNQQLEQLYNLSDKYPVNRYEKSPLKIKCGKTLHETWTGQAAFSGRNILISEKYFKDKNTIVESEARSAKYGWHYKVKDKDLPIYTITHEYGHQVEYEYFRQKTKALAKEGLPFDYKKLDSDLKDTLISNAMRNLDTKMTKTQFKEKYISGYGKSKRNNEWFAELFAKMELGGQDIFTEALREWLGGFYGRR